MTTLLKSALLSALIGFGAIAAMPASAQAQSGGFYLGFGNGNGPGIDFHFDDRGRRYERGRDNHADRDRGRNGWRNGDDWRERGDYRECSARDAMRKARRMGLRHPRVLAEGHRSILVEGLTRGDRFTRVRFGRAPHCPVVR